MPRELTDKETYQFDGQVGSLDHVFASTVGFAKVTGADIWNINSYESLAREYSRYNYNVTDFYRPDPYRASDHDPEIVGFDPGPSPRGSRSRRGRRAAPGPTAIRRCSGQGQADGLTVDAGDVKVYDGGRLIGTAEVVDGWPRSARRIPGRGPADLAGRLHRRGGHRGVPDDVPDTARAIVVASGQPTIARWWAGLTPRTRLNAALRANGLP